MLRGAEPAGRARARAARRRLPGLHHLGRLARLRRRQAARGCATRPSPPAGRTSRSRSAATSTTTSAALRIVREEIGPERKLMVDANQVWDVDRGHRLRWPSSAAFDPCWIEEPTSPDDVLGHAAIAPRARARSRSRPASTSTTGDVQAAAAGRGDRRPARSTPAGSAASTRSLAVLLLAAKFGVPVCPHAGGVGLCELVQHLSMFDYVAVSRHAWTTA